HRAAEPLPAGLLAAPVRCRAAHRRHARGDAARCARTGLRPGDAGDLSLRRLKATTMSIPTTSDHLVRRLHEWGVRRVFGYPGDGINGLMGALQRAQGTIEFVQTRHEELAAFMACAHAKFTGEVGVCMATSGPGAIHLLNGLYDAQLDHQPVLAIVGQQARSALGGDYQQEVDLASLFKDVAHEYLQTIT